MAGGDKEVEEQEQEKKEPFTSSSSSKALPNSVTDAVLVPTSMTLPEDTPIISGFDFNTEMENITLDKILQSYLTTGFQATNFGYAIQEINNMLQWRLSDRDISLENDDDYKDPQVRHYTRCTIFLSYTSNLVSAGIRESIRYLVQHRLVDVLVTTAGGIEEDFIKCLAPTFLGDFSLPGKELRSKGMNRIGNLLVPNSNYCKFEDWIIPIFYKMAEEQAQAREQAGPNEVPFQWTPSKVIHRLGKEINHESSIYYWAYKNNIPVFCPALTDGSLGDMLYFFSYKNPSFTIDIVSDIRRINDIAVRSKCSGMIILGGGLVKHHTCNANLMRNGADYSVFINTGQEFDGSDSGARPDEAISWGKVKIDSRPVKLYTDASLVFPLIVSQTFVKSKEARKVEQQEKQKFMEKSGKGKNMTDIYGELYCE